MKFNYKRFLALFLAVLMIFQTQGTTEIFADTIKELTVIENEDTDAVITEDTELSKEQQENLEELNEDLYEEPFEEEKELIQDEEESSLEDIDSSLLEEGRRSIRDYELDTSEFSVEALSLLKENDYNNLTPEEQDVLLMEVSIRNDTMSVLADNGYSVRESVPIARMMQQLNISFGDALMMIENQGGIGNAVYEAKELRIFSITNPTLSYDQEGVNAITSLLISGFTCEEAINAYTMSLVVDMELSEIAVLNNNIHIEDIVIPQDLSLDRKETLEENPPEAKVEGQDSEKEQEMNAVPESGIELEKEQEDIDDTSDIEEKNEIISKYQEYLGTEDKKTLEIGTSSTSNRNDLLNPAGFLDIISEENIESDYSSDKEGSNAFEINPDEELLGTDEKLPEVSNDNDQEDKDSPSKETILEEYRESIENKEDIENIEFKIDDEDIQLIFELAKSYNVNPDVLVSFMLEHKVSIQGIKDYIAITEQRCRLKEEQTPMQRSAYEPRRNISWQYPSAAPFSYKNNSSETININTGALIYTDNIINLKGKNGLDLDLAFVYDSSEATEDQSYGELSHVSLFEGSSYNMGFYEGRYPLPMSYHAAWRSKNITQIASGWSLNTSKIFWDTEHFFAYNSMDGYNEMYLKLSNGSSYLLERDKNGNYTLKDYKLNDLELKLDINATYPGSSYVINYANGTKEYLGVGPVVAKRDKFGNTISYAYSGTAENGTITITDTMNRVVTIQVGNTVTVTLPDKNKITYTRKKVSPKYMSYTQLADKTDQLGRKTTYEYEIQSGEFDYFSQIRKPRHIFNPADTDVIWRAGDGMAFYSIYRLGGFRFTRYAEYSNAFSVHVNDYEQMMKKNLVGERYSLDSNSHIYHTLKKVTYPTGSYTAYSYAKGIRRLGPLGNADYFAVTNRYDYVNGKKYNDITYKYGRNGNIGNNYCFYDLGELDGSEELDNYKYYVEEKQGNKKTTYIFNNKHRLVDKTVESGNEQIISKNTYSDKGLMTSTENTVKRGSNAHTTKELFEYDNYGNVTAYWSPLAEGDKNKTEYKTTFTYDPTYQMLTSKTYKQDSKTTIKEVYTLDGTKRYVSSIELFLNGTLHKKSAYEANASGMVTKIKNYINPTKFITESYTYKNDIYLASKEVDSLKESFEYDIMGNVTKQVDRNGNQSTFTYDALGRNLKTVKPDKATVTNTYNDKENAMVTTDELGNQFKFTYDGLGFILKSEDLTTAQVVGEVTYDANRNISSDTDANGNTTYYTYDDWGRITELKKSNYTEAYIYDIAFDNMGSKETKIVKGDMNTPDIKTSVYTDKYGRKGYESGYLDNQEIKTTYQYDYLGNVISFLNPEDAKEGKEYTTKYEYSIYSEPVKSIDALGNEIKTAYDFLGRKISVTDAKNNEFTYTYDNFGNVIQETLPFEGQYKAVKKYTYDPNGNLVKLKVPVNKPEEALKEVETKNTYNNLNQLIKTETEGSYTEYAYDKKGNQTELKTANGTLATKYEYDHLGRLIRVEDPMGYEEFYTYDNAGNMLTKTDRNGNTIINKYDSLNNLVAVSAEGENGKVNEYLKYTYGKTNLLEKEENENLTASYAYDSLGRTISISESNGVKKEYTYNLNNNRIKFILSLNGAVKSNLTYEYDALGRLMKVHGNGKEEAFYAYDENGNRSYMKLGNGVETEYTYNNANLIKSLKNKNNEELLSSYGYTYYLDGNQESKTDNKGVSTTYVYDNLGRLTSERQTALDKDTSWNYEYDEAHNRSKMTVNRNGETEATDYTYDKNNRLLREISINAATGVKTLSSYAYDKNGNQLSKMSDVIAPADISLDASLRIYILGDYSNNEEGESFNNPNKQGLLELNTYDVFNRLRTVRREGITAEYGYRADGLRILKTVNGETTIHVWDGSNMVAELDSGLDVKDIYIRGINLISSEENGYYVYNAHGDVVQLSDNDGSITKEYAYDAFGVEEDIDEADGNLFRYCAEYFDQETGNIYLRARYYVPSLGRFMSEDSVQDGLNWYTYSNNNPIRYIDPSGNSFQDIFYTGASVIESYGTGFKNGFIDYFKNRYEQIKTTFKSVTNDPWGSYTSYMKELWSHPIKNNPLVQAVSHNLDVGIEMWANFLSGNPEGAGYIAGGEGGRAAEFLFVNSVMSAVNASLQPGTYETYYRTMSWADYDSFIKTGKIPATSETFISPSQAYAAQYDGVLVEFYVKSGTLSSLENIGVRDVSNLTANQYSGMNVVKTGWAATNAFFKGEGGTINIGLGKGAALNIFNKAIQGFKVLGGN